MVTEIHDALWENQNIRLLVKRDDLLHPFVSGNKYRKLKYNLIEAKNSGYDTLVTVGGAFSNHIYATAAAGKIHNFKTIGIIRGERVEPLNRTLQFAEDCGMTLIFVSRTDYKDKDALEKKYAPDGEKKYWLPEGGTNNLAIHGCTEIMAELENELPMIPDFVCVPCGTGGTAAGILAGKNAKTNVLGFSALTGDFLKLDIKLLLEDYTHTYLSDTSGNIADEILKKFRLMSNYTFGGYAKQTPELLNFINDFQIKFNIPLEPIYTGKMFFGILNMLEKKKFPENSTIVAIHTKSKLIKN